MLSARAIPRDGGILLAGAILLAFCSLLTDVYRIHVGPGTIPAWLPLAIDAAIAGSAGAVLIFGGRLFESQGRPGPSNYVVVAKPVWETVQAEIVAARAQRRMAEAAATSAAPALLAADAAPPAPILNPWDEGPPISPGRGAVGEPEAVQSRSLDSPAPPPGSAGPTPPGTHPPDRAEGVQAQRPPGSPGSIPVTPPRARGAPPPARRAAPPAQKSKDLSPTELDEIARMGGILGIVPLKGERGAAYGQRLARAREALASGGSVAPPTPQPGPLAPVPVENGLQPDIDEMMVWLDKMAAEQANASPGLAPKKEASKPEPSTTDKPSS